MKCGSVPLSWLIGTASNMCSSVRFFWVGLAIRDTTKYFVYAVTAKHLIERVEEMTEDGLVYLRVNFAEQGAQWLQTNIGDWYSHPDEDNVDVSVLPVSLPFGHGLDHRFVRGDVLATESVIQSEGIGVGDEVFLTGLFGRHSGTNRNIPIVRIGNIAAMPEEPIRTIQWAEEMKAYLIESRSIGGLSGSPVFVHLGTVREIDGKPDFLTNKYYLLGLMHGHWDVPVHRVEDGISMDANLFDSIERINMGIAIVVPAKKLLEVLNHPELVQMRANLEANLNKELLVMPNSTHQE